MSAIIITNPAKLRDAIEFAMEVDEAAKNADCTRALGNGLIRLFYTLAIGMSADNDRVAVVHNDFAPHSLGWAVFDNAKCHYDVSAGNRVMNGGWIYAGPRAPGDGSGPSYSVSLAWVAGQEPVHSWSVHT